MRAEQRERERAVLFVRLLVVFRFWICESYLWIIHVRSMRRSVEATHSSPTRIDGLKHANTYLALPVPVLPEYRSVDNPLVALVVVVVETKRLLLWRPHGVALFVVTQGIHTYAYTALFRCVRVWSDYVFNTFRSGLWMATRTMYVEQNRSGNVGPLFLYSTTITSSPPRPPNRADPPYEIRH